MNPPWPSLYQPALEISPIQGKDPIQKGAYYLYHSKDIFRFTLYWTLIFHLPLLCFCAVYAFFNLTFPPSRFSFKSMYFLSSSSPDTPATPLSIRLTPPRPNEGRSRLTFAIIVLLVFSFTSVANAVIGAAVVGYSLAGLYQAADYNMSTWVPFIWAIIIVLIGITNLWPSVIDIIWRITLISSSYQAPFVAIFCVNATYDMMLHLIHMELRAAQAMRRCWWMSRLTLVTVWSWYQINKLLGKN